MNERLDWVCFAVVWVPTKPPGGHLKNQTIFNAISPAIAFINKTINGRSFLRLNIDTQHKCPRVHRGVKEVLTIEAIKLIWVHRWPKSESLLLIDPLLFLARDYQELKLKSFRPHPSFCAWEDEIMVDTDISYNSCCDDGVRFCCRFFLFFRLAKCCLW